MLNSNEHTWVLGLSIDETIEWCLCSAYKEGGLWTLTTNKSDRRYGALPGDPAGYYRSGRLQFEVRNALIDFFQHDNHGLSDHVYAIGVSIVGIADRLNLTLRNIARTDWTRPKRTPVIDFRELFLEMFTKIDVTATLHGINIHNETTAKCLAEWKRQGDTSKVDSLFYVMFSRGVNAAFVADGHPPYTELHTELGHMWPRMYVDDLTSFNSEHSGCRIHKLCFEGLASSRRINNQWGFGKDVSLASLPLPAQLTISYYIAQMCINGVLAVSPARILIGGKTVFSALLPHIREYFRLFNEGLSGEPYVQYPAMNIKDFIGIASIPYHDAGIEASLELARRLLQHPAEALSVGKRRVALGSGTSVVSWKAR